MNPLWCLKDNIDLWDPLGRTQAGCLNTLYALTLSELVWPSALTLSADH